MVHLLVLFYNVSHIVCSIKFSFITQMKYIATVNWQLMKAVLFKGLVRQFDVTIFQPQFVVQMTQKASKYSHAPNIWKNPTIENTKF